MRLEARILLRARQIQLTSELGQPIDYLLGDGDALVRSATGSSRWAAFAFHVMTIAPVANFDPAPFVPICARVAIALPPASRSPSNLQRHWQYSLAQYLDLRLTSDLQAFADLIDCATDKQLLEAFAWYYADDAVRIVIDKPWQALHEEQAETATWKKLLAVYERLLAAARLRKVGPMIAHTVRALIILHAEYLFELHAAQELTTLALDQDQLTDGQRFLIIETLSCLYLYKSQMEKATALFDQALSIETTEYPDVRAWSLMELAKVQDDDNLPRSIELLNESIDICRQNPVDVSEIRLITALGELAIVYWLSADIPKTFAAIDEATDRLLKLTRTDDVKRLIVMVGHCLGYYAVIATTGEPPTARKGTPIQYHAVECLWVGKESKLNGSNRNTTSDKFHHSIRCFATLLILSLNMHARSIGLEPVYNKREIPDCWA